MTTPSLQAQDCVPAEEGQACVAAGSAVADPRPARRSRVSASEPKKANTPFRERPGKAGTDVVDQDLVERVQRGETRAFDLLVSRYQQRLASLLGRYIADPAEREDVAQETLLRAYRGLSRFRGESAFYTWLYRIAVNTARNHQASAGRRPSSGGADPAEAEGFDDGVLLRDTDTPEGNAAMGEVSQAIQAALASMPETLRRAITLREYEGLSYEEIATFMDCPIGTVRSRIARARTLIDEFVRPVLERPGAVGARSSPGA